MRIFNNFWQWLSGFFKDEETPVRIPVKRKKYTRRKKTIKSLLENMEDSFKELKSAHAVYKSCRGDFPSHLLKMGPTICDSIKGEEVSETVKTSKRPTWLFFGLSTDESQSGENVLMKYIGLEKIARPGAYVQPSRNAVYRVYACWKLDGKHYWVSCHAAISNSGQITLLREMLGERLSLPNGGSYVKRYWDTPKIFDNDNGSRIKTVISAAFAFCARKENYWVISVKKEGKRMNFAIPREETKHYFSDRDTVVSNGKKRTKIMHYVEGHHRATSAGTTWVRPHIRGERQFVWNGYQCNIKAPEFGGKEAGAFDVGGSAPEEINGKCLDQWETAKTVLRAQDNVQENAFSNYRQ